MDFDDDNNNSNDSDVATTDLFYDPSHSKNLDRVEALRIMKKYHEDNDSLDDTEIQKLKPKIQEWHKKPRRKATRGSAELTKRLNRDRNEILTNLEEAVRARPTLNVLGRQVIGNLDVLARWSDVKDRVKNMKLTDSTQPIHPPSTLSKSSRTFYTFQSGLVDTGLHSPKKKSSCSNTPPPSKSSTSKAKQVLTQTPPELQLGLIHGPFQDPASKCKDLDEGIMFFIEQQESVKKTTDAFVFSIAKDTFPNEMRIELTEDFIEMFDKVNFSRDKQLIASNNAFLMDGFAINNIASVAAVLRQYVNRPIDFRHVYEEVYKQLQIHLEHGFYLPYMDLVEIGIEKIKAKNRIKMNMLPSYLRGTNIGKLVGTILSDTWRIYANRTLTNKDALSMLQYNMKMTNTAYETLLIKIINNAYMEGNSLLTGKDLLKLMELIPRLTNLSSQNKQILQTVRKSITSVFPEPKFVYVPNKPVNNEPHCMFRVDLTAPSMDFYIHDQPQMNLFQWVGSNKDRINVAKKFIYVRDLMELLFLGKNKLYPGPTTSDPHPTSFPWTHTFVNTSDTQKFIPDSLGPYPCCIWFETCVNKGKPGFVSRTIRNFEKWTEKDARTQFFEMLFNE